MWIPNGFAAGVVFQMVACIETTYEEGLIAVIRIKVLLDIDISPGARDLEQEAKAHHGCPSEGKLNTIHGCEF